MCRADNTQPFATGIHPPAAGFVLSAVPADADADADVDAEAPAAAARAFGSPSTALAGLARSPMVGMRVGDSSSKGGKSKLLASSLAALEAPVPAPPSS